MEEALNTYLFKNANEAVKKVTIAIRDAIKGTQFEGKVYLSGGTVRNLILGVNNDGTYEIVVEKQCGGVAFAGWLCKKINKVTTASNPIINEEWGLGCFSLDLDDDDAAAITIEASQTMKQWPENTTMPISMLYGTLMEDAFSRDFTINALYYDISANKIIDKIGSGLFDIASKIIRTTRAANYTFRCSPIRMLRGIRLAGQLGFSFDKATWMSMLGRMNLITTCENSDIRLELNKILLSDKPSVSLNRLLTSGMLKYILPDVHSLKDVTEFYKDKTSFLDHTFNVVDSVFPQLENRLAALMHDVGMVVDATARMDVDEFSADCAYDLLKEMGYKKKTCINVSMAIQYHHYFSMYMDGVTPNTKRIKKFMEICDDEFPLVLDLMNAENKCSKIDPKPRQVLKILKKIEELQNEGENKKNELILPVNGNDIMKELGLSKGHMVGHLMKKLKNKFKENSEMTRDECVEYAKKVYESVKDKA